MSREILPTIERIDHGVLPSNDLGRAYRFWSKIMGGEIDHPTKVKNDPSETRRIGLDQKTFLLTNDTTNGFKLFNGSFQCKPRLLRRTQN